MKKAIWIISITAVFVFVIFGILYGWFRSEPKLDTREMTALNSVERTSRVSARNGNVASLFYKLWYDHVRLTRDVIVAMFANDPSLKAKEQELLKNQEDIGNAINAFYNGSYNVVTSTLKEHILIATDILQDLKYKRLGRLPSDINKWYDNADKFSQIMIQINPAWNLKSHMREHLRITEREAVYQWLGAKQQSLKIYNDKIVPQAQEIANQIVSGIT